MKKKDVWKISFRSHKLFSLKYALRLNCLDNQNLEYEKRLLYFIHRYHHKINNVCKNNGLKPLETLIEYNTYDIHKDIPNKLENYIIDNSKWVPAIEAYMIIQRLHDKIYQDSIRFGWFPNHRKQVLNELEISLKFAKTASQKNGQFNLCLLEAPENDKHRFIWG